MVSDSIVKRIGRNTFDTFTFGGTILDQPLTKIADSQFKTTMEFIGVDVEVCAAEVMIFVLEGDTKLSDRTDFHILYLGEFDTTGEPIGEEFNVLFILCVHR